MGSSVLKHWKVVTPQGLGLICGRSEFYVLFYWCVIAILWGGHYAVICRRRRPIYSSADWRTDGGRASGPGGGGGIRACGGGGGIRTGGGGGGRRADGGGDGIRADRVCSMLPSICRSSTPAALEKNASFALLADASNSSSGPCAAVEYSMNPFDGVTIGE